MSEFSTPHPDDINASLKSIEELQAEFEAAIAKAQETGAEGDFVNAEKLQKLVTERLQPLQYEAERRELTFEYKEAKLDILETVRFSEDFYKSHNLDEFPSHIPEEIHLSPEQQTRIQKALAEGFDRAMIIPPISIQTKSLRALINEMTEAPYRYIPNSEQYQESDINSTAQIIQPTDRPAGAYLLLYQSGVVPEETKNKMPFEIYDIFYERKWLSLTLTEYLIIQRRELEKRKNHGFDVRDDNEEKSQGILLLDSWDGDGIGNNVVDAYWDPIAKRVQVGVSNSAHKHSGYGARPTVVIELE